MDLTRRSFLQGLLAAAAATAYGAPVDKKPKKILILGGTGFLGPALVEVARKRGHTLTLFNRGKTNPGLFPDLEQLHGDRNGKLDALKGRTWDVVIDDSGYVPRHVHDSATLLAGSGHYLFVSTISVYADTSKPVDENAQLATLKEPTEKVTGETYGALKAGCEQAAQAAMPGKVTIIRPGLIVGPGDQSDRFTYWPVRCARGGEILAPGAATDPVQFIDVRDLAAWMIAVAEKSLHGVYNALGPARPLGIGEMLAACMQATASKGKLTWVDAAFLEKQKVQPWADMPVWIPPVGEGAYAAKTANARAVAAGLTFRPPVDTARDTWAWWQKQPDERRAKLRAGLSAEREAEVLAAWHKK